MNDMAHVKDWVELPPETKIRIYTDTGAKVGLLPIAVEKDWWVVHTLSLIFSMDCGPSVIFKGGTSLSKGWNIIERFSEDIDLALDRTFLGFKGDISKAEIRRLKKESYKYMTGQFTPELGAKFIEAGIPNVEVKYREVKNHDQDPLIVEIYFPKLTEQDTYMKPGVLVEIGSRSLREPCTDRTFSTMVAENFTGQPFCDKPITVPTVNPERTFLEKIFLLHEEFQQPDEKKRVERMSRHLYDIERLSKTEYAEIALQNSELYNTIVAHRHKFTHISNVDYSKHTPNNIQFVPPPHMLSDWETDYIRMQDNMIYGESLPFDELIARLTVLQSKINSLQWKK